MNIVILGATGYLGSKLVKELLLSGHNVLALKRENSSLKNLKNIQEGLQICNLKEFEEILTEKPVMDCFVNAACRYPRNASSDAEIYQANLVAPLEIFFKCLEGGVKKYITIGTGLPKEFNSYTVSKQKFLEICKWYGKRQGDMGKPIQICNIALENFYGEDEPKDRFIPNTIEKLKKNENIQLTEGDQKRDFIYIGDVIVAIKHIIEMSNLPEYLDLPLGTGEEVAVRSVIEYLKEITDSKSELQFGAIKKRMYEPDSVADCTKMKEMGIEIKYSWREGLKKLL